MSKPNWKTSTLVCLVLFLSGGFAAACNFSTLSLISETSLGGGQYQYVLQMCSPGGCDGVDVFGVCIGSQMNDNTGNWSIGVSPPATIAAFTGNLSSPINGSVFNGSLTSASTFVNYTNAANWWTYQTTAIVPSQPLCVNLTIVTNGIPADICAYGLEGADLIFLPPACPQVLGQTCVQPTVLEVEFIDFKASLEGDKVNLEWSTAMERNHDRFVVERSPDGGHYTAVGEVPGMGESQELQAYSYTHLFPEPGMNYYRISAVDLDGLSQNTEAIQILYEPQSFKLDQIYPNPATDYSQVEFIATQAGKGAFVVQDMEGRIVLRKDLDIEQGRNAVRLEMADWSAGLYVLTVAGDGGRLQTKLIKR